MCGYCFEGAMISYVWDAWHGEIDKESLRYFGYIVMQEPQLFTLVNGEEEFLELRPCPLVEFCLLLKELFLNGFSSAILDNFSLRHGRDVLMDCLDKACIVTGSGAWKKLFNAIRRRDSTAWARHLKAESDELLVSAKAELFDYLNAWIFCEEKDTDVMEMDAYGVFDPVCYAQDLRKDYPFDDKFPLLFASLICLQVNCPDDDLIVAIALVSPSLCPSFSGHDLWLRRRAVAHCLCRTGVSFLLDNSNSISFTVLEYLILMQILSVDDLIKLKHFVLSGSEPRAFNDGSIEQDVPELLTKSIQMLVSQSHSDGAQNL